MPHLLRSVADHLAGSTPLQRVAGALAGPLEKGLVHTYTRHMHGVAQVVPEHMRADPAAIIGMLAKRHHHQLSFDLFGGGGGGAPPAVQPHGAGNGGTVQRDSMYRVQDQEPAVGSIAQATFKPEPAPPATQTHRPRVPQGLHLPAEKAEARKVLEGAHRDLVTARQLEEDAKLEPGRREALLARATTLRARLADAAGPDYERAVEGKLVANYAPEIGGVVADWAHKVGVPVERDAHGRPSGNFGLLHAEALDAAYQAVHRYRTHNRTGLLKLVKGQVEQRLFRHWKRAVGKGAFNMGQNEAEDASKVARYTSAHASAYGEQPTDEQVAEALGMTPKRVADIKRQAIAALGDSLNQTSEDGSELGERVGSSRQDPARRAEADELSDAVHTALAELDPLKRATVRVAHGMGLDADTAAHLAAHTQLDDLAAALQDHAHLAEPDARATAAVGAVQWRAPGDAALRVRAALHLLDHGADPVQALQAPEQREDGDKHDISVSEVYRRVGLKPANSGSVLRSAEQALARHPALVGFRDALHKSLFAPIGTPWGSLLAAIAPAALLASLPAPLAALAPSLLEDDRHGWALVREDRAAEAAILAAAAQGGGDETVHGDGAGR
jgi:hypothetical protein